MFDNIIFFTKVVCIDCVNMFTLGISCVCVWDDESKACNNNNNINNKWLFTVMVNIELAITIYSIYFDMIAREIKNIVHLIA